MIAEYYRLLKEYIGFKSISVDNNFDLELKNSAQRLKDLFLENKFEVEVINKDKKPIIIASYIFDESVETALIYGNYDIIDAKQKDGWKEDPFNLFIGKNKIVGRGVVDNKGQNLLHMVSIFNLIKEDRLGYNVIFLLEGEKEIGSPSLKKYIETNYNTLKANFILISNGSIGQENPIIEVGFRGNINVQLEIYNMNNSLDIGQYGGVVANPLEELTKLLSKLHDSNQQITIPYFYYEVENLTANQKTLNSKIPFDENLVKNNYNLKNLNLKNTDYFTKTGRTPCVEITGISSGKTSFFNNSIPNKAVANLNFKLVSNQKCESIKSLFEERIKSNLTNGLGYNIKFDKCSKPVTIDTQNYFINKADELLQKIYQNKVYHVKSGSSLDIIGTLQELISSKILSIPSANNDSNSKGINENFDIELIEKALRFSYEFFKK